MTMRLKDALFVGGFMILAAISTLYVMQYFVG